MVTRLIARIVEMLFITLMVALLAGALLAAINPQMFFYLWSFVR
jgi:Sec-independent protein secretion pathway component TatC